MKKLALFALLSLSACLGDPTGGTTGLEGSSSTSTTTSIETTGEPCATEGCGLEPGQSDANFSIDPDTQEDNCPKVFCATWSASCMCECSATWPFPGSLSCCSRMIHAWAANANGCGASSIESSCRTAEGINVPPISCGTTYSCPTGSFPSPVDPENKPTCNGCEGACFGPSAAICENLHCN